MHDPDTQAFQICWPWFSTTTFKSGLKMRFWKPAITIWHHDPTKRGDEDSCGWFIRGRHCNQEVLQRITKRFAEDWDRVFKSDSGTIYHCGLFCPDGDPRFSVHGIALNLFFCAAFEHFKSREKAFRFIQKHLFEILFFAENPVDSLHDGFTRKFEIGCGEKHTPERREERIRNTASCIYSWMCRELRPWYRHPRWHVWHWRLQIHFWQWLKRGLFDRCSKCGKGFKFGSSCMSDWNGTQIWHDACDDSSKTPVTQ